MLLKLLHVRQQQPTDCLVACAAMVLGYLQIPSPYRYIRQLLGTTAIGTPFHRLDRLRVLGTKVVRGEGSLSLVADYLTAGVPVIVDVDTAELPYWQMRVDLLDEEKVTAHAVVVMGLDEQRVYVYDPDIALAPQAISHGDFELAWLMRDDRYAVIQN